MDELPNSSDGPHVNLVFIGPCGCGKSTTAGHLIADCGAIDRPSLERIAYEAGERGQDDCRYAWILDKLRSERERGGSIYVAHWSLTTRKCRFTIIDAPGHGDFAKDTVTAMSQADLAVLVVTAVPTNLDVGKACMGQIREHTLLAHTLGVRQLVVCVNMMDSEAVAYSECHFDWACAVVRADLENVGYATDDVLFVPTSGLTGDNIALRSTSMAWYGGPTLLEALHLIAASARPAERPLRLPISEVMQIGGTGVVAVGRVETGSLRPDMRLVFAPGNVMSTVVAINMYHETMDEAVQGDSVNIFVDVSRKDLRRGMVGSAAAEDPARECATFLAQVIVLSPPRAGEIGAGCVLLVDCHTAQVPCLFEELLSRTDRRTGNVLEIQPTTLHAGDAAVVRLRPTAPMCVEPFGEYPPLGRFTVRDQKTTVAVGVVQEVNRAIAPAWSPTAKAVILRAKPAKVHAATKPKALSPIGNDNDDVCLTCPASSPTVAESPFAAFGATTKKRAKAPRGHEGADASSDTGCRDAGERARRAIKKPLQKP